jgi:NAD dependent epimerase/dehydratase family enzyme
VSGPVNITAPTPATNAEVTRALAQALRRPALLPVPALALKVALGEFASEVLGSSRVLPAALTAAGFTFTHPDIDSATRALVTP